MNRGYDEYPNAEADGGRLVGFLVSSRFLRAAAAA
jgi:hypothetical protein